VGNSIGDNTKKIIDKKFGGGPI